MLKLSGPRYLGVVLCATSLGISLGGIIHNPQVCLYVTAPVLLLGLFLSFRKGSE